MFNFFESIFEFIGSLFTYIGMLIMGIAQLFVLIVKGMGYVTVCIAMMPPIIQAFLLAFVGISVVYLIVGR